MRKIESYLYKVQDYLAKKHTITEAERFTAPLFWYINTGRSSVEFDALLMEQKPFVIGRILAKGGSYDEAISAICAKIGYKRI